MADSKYNPTEIESKWQKVWQKEKLYQALDFSEKKKYYLLVEFPYPSGAGLHIGHVRSWGAMDAYACKKRMEGYNVLYPMGWDAFGLSFDWTREIDTTDPKYYKWTQWIFLQLFKKNLAYQAEVLVNWCPKCKTNLADEEVLPN